MSKQSRYLSAIFNILKPIYIGIIIGFVYGLSVAGFHIWRNDYFHYELYNLVLISIQQDITKYSIILVSITVLVSILIFIFTKADSFIYNRFPETDKYLRKKVSVIIPIAFIAILALIYIFRVYATDVLAFLRSLPISDWFGQFSKSRKNSREIYLIVLNVLLISIGIFTLVRFKILQKMSNRYYRIADNKAIKSIALTLFVLIAVLNLFTFGYKKLNAPEGMNVVLISIDTLRADHLGAYGYDRNTSPNIDKLAEMGVLFENAYAQSPWTLPSMASMVTSLYPLEHGVTHRKYRITDSTVTLAEYMRNDFYNTIGVVSNRFVSAKFGFAQGFDKLDSEVIGLSKITSKLITDRAIEYLSNNGDNKFFLWLHYMDPHSNYMNHPEFGYSSDYKGSLKPIKATVRPYVRIKNLNKIIDSLNSEDVQYAIDLYDEEISFTDTNIGRIFETLEESGKSDNTIIIITADHGEELLDKTRFGHNTTLYDELIRVPLIVYVPSMNKLNAKRSDVNVEVRSIAKTITDLVGIRKTRFSGENLLIVAEENKKDNIAYSMKQYGNMEFPESEGIVVGDWKLIKHLSDSTYELYNLKNDPLEKKNLFETQEGMNGIRRKLISKLSEMKQERTAVKEETVLDEEDIKELKALGYID